MQHWLCTQNLKRNARPYFFFLPMASNSCTTGGN